MVVVLISSHLNLADHIPWKFPSQHEPSLVNGWTLRSVKLTLPR